MYNAEYREKYTTKVQFPSMEQYTTFFVYKQGLVIFEGDAEAFTRLKHTFGKNPVVEKVFDTEKLNAARQLYSEDQDRLERLFKEHLFTEHGVLDNPKRHKCFTMAWDYGHSAGYGEVASYFDTLVDLIKD